MPQRAPTACRRPGCRGLVRGGVCSVCGPQRQHGREDYDERRGNAASRGYDAKWRKLREQVLYQQPLCVMCGAVAVDVDHIIPIRQGGPVLAVDNLQPLCRQCHVRKTTREQPGDHMTQVIIVCGPPGSGKTSYVAERCTWGDLIVDVDAILAAISGLPWYDKPTALLPVALDVRDYLYTLIRRDIADVPRAWVITSEADAKKRGELAQRVRAESVVVLEVSPAECLRRISLDARRADAWQQWQPIVERWWTQYGRNAGDVVVTG